MNYFVIHDDPTKKIDVRLNLEQFHRSNRMLPAGLVHCDISHFDCDNRLYDESAAVYEH